VTQSFKLFDVPLTIINANRLRIRRRSIRACPRRKIQNVNKEIWNMTEVTQAGRHNLTLYV